MSDSHSLQLVRFSKTFDRAAFLSGQPEIDTWLKAYASQHEASGVSRTYLLTRPGSSEILGYFALGIGLYFPSPNLQLKASRYGLRMLELFRIGVSIDYQGQGLASMMLREVFQIALQVADSVGVQGVVVQPISKDLIDFYQRFGFREFRFDPLEMAIGIRDIRRAATIGVHTGHVQERGNDNQV
jgi:ribosomal protein S18 acetylase RimI-like enzyme